MKKLASLIAGAVLASSAAMVPVDEAEAFWGSGWGGGPWGWGGYPCYGGWGGGPWGWGGYPGYGWGGGPWGYGGYGGWGGYGWGGYPGWGGYGWGYPAYGYAYPAVVAPAAPATTQAK